MSLLRNLYVHVYIKQIKIMYDTKAQFSMKSFCGQGLCYVIYCQIQYMPGYHFFGAKFDIFSNRMSFEGSETKIC